LICRDLFVASWNGTPALLMAEAEQRKKMHMIQAYLGGKMAIFYWSS
jgi:hypothetical protein